MVSVFSFGGITDLSMGVLVTGINRVIKPPKRNVQTVVAGRSGTYDTTTNAYDNTQIVMDCMYTGTNAPQFARQMASWLSGTNDLIIADEPDKTYTATVWVDIPEDYVFSLRHFTLTFTCQPFARSETQQTSRVITTSGGGILLDVEGTAPTPCRIIIENTGNTTITNLSITHSVIQ